LTQYKRKSKCNRRGFSLAEAMIAVVLLGAVASGVILPFNTGMRLQSEGAKHTLAAKLAADLMERVIAEDFDNIMNVYGSYSESQGHIKDVEATTFTDPKYNNFSREANCEYVTVAQETGDGDVKFIRAQVKVFYSGTETAVINRLITR